MNRLFYSGLVFMTVAVVVLFLALAMELATAEPVWVSVTRGGVVSFAIGVMLLMVAIAKWAANKG